MPGDLGPGGRPELIPGPPTPPYIPPTGSIQSGIQSRAIGHLTIDLHTTSAGALPYVTGNTVSALIYIEAATGSAENAIIARYWQDGSAPTTEEGFPLKANQFFEIKGYANIVNFRIITANALAHTLQIQYFS
ncbi:hypothetical protein Pedsa_0867 [Pseudopedobacter saltans DSM 12145]|uniref:Uncharacterized protein n=1 Tax=Pseudopedobacter saltans (strain ATCC 51119 / DSM 12145 / JCM 21818 / CCUG 39354 / LMG 10337 / NBRC 100064 / NCIMB 13643) TaxID=762903 RepID=F0S9T3_PSESL|nr:hypothetical protein [Pseudopedobacter saltans]ADY51439.1 hypothetical protein Pedsa_0867 [Pseudopedobacter saltans DSM 12145]